MRDSEEQCFASEPPSRRAEQAHAGAVRLKSHLTRRILKSVARRSISCRSQGSGDPGAIRTRDPHGNVDIIRSPVRAVVLPANLLVQIWGGSPSDTQAPLPKGLVFVVSAALACHCLAPTHAGHREITRRQDVEGGHRPRIHQHVVTIVKLRTGVEEP
jgi:hypothetical protein